MIIRLNEKNKYFCIRGKHYISLEEVACEFCKNDIDKGKKMIHTCRRRAMIKLVQKSKTVICNICNYSDGCRFAQSDQCVKQYYSNRVVNPSYFRRLVRERGACSI